MFDIDGSSSVFAAASPAADAAASPVEPPPVPLERLERFARAHRQVTRSDDATLIPIQV